MAQGRQEHGEHGTPNGVASDLDTEAWRLACEAAKYNMHNGGALIGSKFPDKERGFITAVLAPAGFGGLDKRLHIFAAQAMLEMAQNRGGQNSDPNSAAEYSAGVHKIMYDRDSNARVRDKDAIGMAVDSHIRTVVAKRYPDASEDDLKKTVADNGEAYAAKYAATYLTEGFPVLKETKGKKASAKSLLLDDPAAE